MNSFVHKITREVYIDASTHAFSNQTDALAFMSRKGKEKNTTVTINCMFSSLKPHQSQWYVQVKVKRGGPSEMLVNCNRIPTHVLRRIHKHKGV